MGPDCGTSIVGGVGIGFANAVRRGTIGVIGPAGTGLQEFTCQVHHAGGGISHAIGTGSHDLSDDIGGATTLSALEALERDPSTKVIAIVAKPGGDRTREVLTSRLQACSKPVVACLLGVTDREPGPGLDWSATIDAAALTAIERCAIPVARPASALTMTDPGLGLQDDRRRAASQRYLRGLFAGGTLCYQSQQILRQAGLTVLSNAPLSEDASAAGSRAERRPHADRHGRRRAHAGPAAPHDRRDAAGAADRRPRASTLRWPSCCSTSSWAPTPPRIPSATSWGRSWRAGVCGRQEAGELTVVASICGTEGDPQDLRASRAGPDRRRRPCLLEQRQGDGVLPRATGERVADGHARSDRRAAERAARRRQRRPGGDSPRASKSRMSTSSRWTGCRLPVGTAR